MPEQTDVERRDAILAVYPQCAELSSSFRTVILNSSLSKFLDYTHQSADLGERIDDIIIELALIKVNMLGAEGSTSASEGGISRVWEDIPSSLKRRMNAYRLVIGNATDSS